MKKYFVLFSILVLCFRAESTTIPLVEPTSPATSITTPIQPILNISTLKTKDIEKLLGRKLKFKEKIAIKVFQWKYKKGRLPKKTETPGNKGTTAMILGIVGIAALFVPYLAIVALPCAILAIVFGNKAKKTNPDDGQAKAGVVLGIITLTVFAIAVVIAITVLATGGAIWFG